MWTSSFRSELNPGGRSAGHLRPRLTARVGNVEHRPATSAIPDVAEPDQLPQPVDPVPNNQLICVTGDHVPFVLADLDGLLARTPVGRPWDEQDFAAPLGSQAAFRIATASGPIAVLRALRPEWSSDGR